MKNETAVTRPTKRQYELLSFIEDFITKHGYSPSYREIMAGLNYTSVATVAAHVNNLIRRGHLRKRDRSARSLEVVHTIEPDKIVPKQIDESEEKWLVQKIDQFFKELEDAPVVLEAELDKLYVLAGALKVLGSHGAAQSFVSRLTELKKKAVSKTDYVV